ncbi:hypothetical protein [Paenibacillus chitinolyticus]
MKRKVSSLLLSAVILVGILPNLAMAKGDPSESELNKYMEKHGYPQEVITMFDFDQKLNVYKQEASFVSTKKSLSNLGEGLSSSLDVGTKSLSNFSESVTMSLPSYSNGQVKFIVDYNWDWNSAPVFTMTDKFGVAWNDNFVADQTTAKYSYRAFGQKLINGTWYDDEASTGTINSYVDPDPGKGIGWAVNLIAGFTHNNIAYTTYRHKGWGQVSILRTNNTSSTTAVKGQYFHQQMVANGSLSFSASGPSIGISSSWAYDQSNGVQDWKQW